MKESDHFENGKIMLKWILEK